jgi:hypothetical protein
MTPAASGCNMANAGNLGAFVQATILDPATGALSVYEPLDHPGHDPGGGTRGAHPAGECHRHHRRRLQRH